MRNIALIAAALIAMTACTGQSSNSSSQSASDQSSSSASASTDSSSSSASRSDASGGIPDYPGAATEAAGSGNNMGESASGKVMTTADSFDKVYGWYQQHMPSGSEKSHTTSPINSAVFTLGDTSSGQKSVTITTQGDKTMITIASVKS